MTLKLVEDWAVTQLRRDVRDALQLDGEQCIILSLRHPVADGSDPKCPECHDDLYNEGEVGCRQCYGTGFAEPIKEMAKVWAVFTDNIEDEDLGKRGVWTPDNRTMQTEAFPKLMQHDVVVRVRRWTPDGRVAEVDGYFGVSKVTYNSVRTGNRMGQYSWDVVGQKANVDQLIDGTSGITNFPVLGKKFDVPVVEPVGTMAVPAPVQPDTRVVYIPIIPPDPQGAPLTPTKPGLTWRQVFFHNQTTPSTVWTIEHPFDHEPSVTLFINDEEGDTDVAYPNGHTVVLTFAAPQAGVAQLI
jgi:hypothetical protein